VTTAEWVGAFSAVAALIAAVAAAVSAKASRDTARTLKAERDEDRRRLELEPLMELHAALEEFVTNIVLSSEGSPDANRLHRRVVAIVAYRRLPNVPLDKTTHFVGQEVGTVDDAAAALAEVADALESLRRNQGSPSDASCELERRLRERLDALGPAPRAELLHVLMSPTSSEPTGSESSGATRGVAPSPSS